MTWDKRSLSRNHLRYSLRERVLNKFSMNVMPFLTHLALSNRLNTLVWRLLGVRCGAGSLIRMGTEINNPANLVIGRHCLVHGCLKTRGGGSCSCICPTQPARCGNPKI